MKTWKYGSTFTDLGTRWVISFTPLLLYALGKSPLNPLDQRLDYPQNQSLRCEDEKIVLLQESNTDHSVASRYTE
jgi:hypothetical protein